MERNAYDMAYMVWMERKAYDMAYAIWKPTEGIVTCGSWTRPKITYGGILRNSVIEYGTQVEESYKSYTLVQIHLCTILHTGTYKLETLRRNRKIGNHNF